MGWAKSLKKFLETLAKCSPVQLNFNLNILPNLSEINICRDGKIKSSVHLDNDTKSLFLNIDKMSEKERQQLKAIIPEIYDESGSILRSDTRKLIENFRQVEADPATAATLDYFRPLIPADDWPILRSSLYMKECHRRDRHPEGDRTKSAIVETYGDRGRNIANLYSAGYFDDWFRPLHEALVAEHEDVAEAKRAFEKIYETIVKDAPWTVFVSRHRTKSAIKTEIVGKLQKNVGYGIKWLNVHGLGQDNVDTITSICGEVEKEGLASVVRSRTEPRPRRIFVRLECA